MGKATNILIIKPGALGDLLQMTPVIRALRKKLPDARISLLVGSVLSVELFRHNPLVDEVIVFDKRGMHRSLSGLIKLWRQLHSARYDLVLNFQRSNLKTQLLATAAFPCRLLVYHKARKRTIHAVQNHLETVAPLGIGGANPTLELFCGPEAEKFAMDLFATEGLAGKTVIAFNPGASNRIKCWSPHQFAELGDRLIGELGARVVIVGGSDERDLAEAICTGMKATPLDVLGKTSLLQLGAILRRCTVVVSGDTGPMHMATAVGTPVVALFGAIDPRRTGPVGEGHVVLSHPEIPCVPCNGKTCSNPAHLECMEKISVEEVFRTVASMITEGRSCGIRERQAVQ